MSFTPYTTPTPLPHRPHWNKTDWVEYFASNHPNIWFREQLEKNKTLSESRNSSSEPEPTDETQLDLDEEESKTFSIVVEKEENDSSDSGISWTLDKKENQESLHQNIQAR